MMPRPLFFSLILSATLIAFSGCADPNLIVGDDQAAHTDASTALAKQGSHWIPFRGTWFSPAVPPAPPEETPDGCDAYFMIPQVGRATHLGAFTSSSLTCASNVRFLEVPPFNFTGGTPPFFVADFSNEMTWTAANGDKLFLSPNDGIFVQSTTDGTSSVRGSLTIDGGTGRFAGATGYANVRGTGDPAGEHIRFEGRIHYAASARNAR